MTLPKLEQSDDGEQRSASNEASELQTQKKPFGSEGYSVELLKGRSLSDASGEWGAEEKLKVTRPDGSSETFRLWDYERVFSFAGLYEEVVHRRLRCASPNRVAGLLVDFAKSGGDDPKELRVLDIAAGNGIVGEELRILGVEVIVGLDNAPAARDATERDRPGIYTEYRVGDIRDASAIEDLIARHRLNAVTCAGAIGHLPFDGFTRTWSTFPTGSYLSLSFYDATDESVDPLDDAYSAVGAYLRSEISAGRFQPSPVVRFQHRLTMRGESISGACAAGRRLSTAR